MSKLFSFIHLIRLRVDNVRVL